MPPAQTTEGADSPRDLVRPGVAKEWKVSGDGLTYTFSLRKNARWSDGAPLTAHDFEFAWRRVLEPDSPADYGALMYVIEGAEAYANGNLKDWDQVGIETPGSHTLKVRLKHPTSYFPDMVDFYTFFPQPRHVVREHGSNWTRAEHMVVNGPYELQEYRPQQAVKLKKNDDYRAADEVSIDRATFRIIKDPDATVAAFDLGDGQRQQRCRLVERHLRQAHRQRAPRSQPGDPRTPAAKCRSAPAHKGPGHSALSLPKPLVGRPASTRTPAALPRHSPAEGSEPPVSGTSSRCVSSRAFA